MDTATIAAIATPAGMGGVGMVRLSGVEAPEIAARVFRLGKRGSAPDLRRTQSHRLLYGRVVDPETEEMIDEVLLAWMAAPKTYTREDT
ncbi:MAG TPA: tRNA uridine-5-carboxymethylaminomethyl(34) synthesis GTPase MnmE, partial [Thermomicrobiales bacterium]|nr:tRNA uridine-5-carboxymethylaminomethyl(34) synthesis GTPase MnmE [Thermomicrobiales bacterium]